MSDKPIPKRWLGLYVALKPEPSVPKHLIEELGMAEAALMEIRDCATGLEAHRIAAEALRKVGL